MKVKVKLSKHVSVHLENDEVRTFVFLLEQARRQLDYNGSEVDMLAERIFNSLLEQGA